MLSSLKTKNRIPEGYGLLSHSLRRHYPDQVRGVDILSSQAFQPPPGQIQYRLGLKKKSTQDIYLMRKATCPKTIVYIHHCYTRHTGIKHSKKGCETAKACAISDGCWNCDNWLICETPNNRGESTFHTCNDQNHFGRINIFFNIHKSMYPP